MIIDVVTIFPDYLAPLALSLPGKAVESGLLTLRTHDLRDWTHDRHRTVDDTPYGGGAGMVMKPEPWGEALDALLANGPTPRLLVMTPSGTPFTQADAERLSHEERLVFACGRYEGIDARVVDWAREHMPVEEISIGDYVLNGGEVAAMVCIEAIVRLVPGFMGNPQSIVEESYSGTEPLLEYPAYTKPPRWRGHDVPDVLFSGDHGRIAAWRAEQAALRTRERRPDLWTRPPVGPRLLDLDPGLPPETDQLRFEVLGPEHNEADHAAWTASIDHIRASPGWASSPWPREPEPPELNALDLARRRARHEAGVEYAWAVLDRETGEYVGAVYVTPSSQGPTLRSWVRADRAALDRPLRAHLAGWVASWPVRVRVSRR